MNDDAERRRLADALTFREDPPIACDEDTERLWDAAAGGLDGEALDEVLAHVRACAECAEAYQLAVKARQPDMPAADAEPHHLPPPANRRWFGPVVSVLAVAAVIAAIVLNRPEPTWRGDDDDTIELLVPDGSSATIELYWEAGPTGTRYAVLVATDDLTPVAEPEGLTVTRYTIDPADLTGLASGTQLTWQVTATAPDGSKQTSAIRTLIVE